MSTTHMSGPDSSLVARWRTVSARLAEHEAFVSAGSSYTFAVADAASDEVAAVLAAHVGGDQSPVGLLAGHDATALVGLLGIWKAERMAVVLDPHLPAARLDDIVALAGVSTLLVDGERAVLAKELAVDAENLLALEEPEPGLPVSRRPLVGFRSSDAPRDGEDGAAIVFTSGSTGRPKGVVQTHGQLLNDVEANGAVFGITPEDRVALVFPYGFAAGLSLLCVAALNGASLHSYDPRANGVRRLASWIRDQRITTLHCTPHLLRSLVATLAPGERLDPLRLVSTAGEAVHGSDVESLRPHLASTATFVNWCGSSEMGTFTLFPVHADDPLPTGALPVGRPILHKEVWIQRADGTRADVGEAGEVIAVSRHLSGGYWHDDEANALRFTTLADGRRTCRQGDLGRIDAAGILTLLGRADAATKVRGYLVEPSEVEAAFLRIEVVRDVVVLPVVAPPAPTRLLAYVVPEAGRRTASAAALRRALRETLPEYMVPSTIVQLTALPRNERGKVDRSRLPDVEASTGTGTGTGTGTEPPTSQRDLVLADIWGEVLGLDSIGLDDDFMALGGDSLAAEEALTTVQERLNVSLVSSDLIKAPTLREFSQRVALGRASLPSHPDVVTLRAEGSQTPLHCFAGAGALALTFLPLARRLSDRRAYAYQSHGLEKRGVPDWSVQAAARRYLEILRVVQPHGPYLLLGHSFGGLVALEVAAQLTSAGEEVQLVGLLDTYLPQSVGTLEYEYETMRDRSAPPNAPRRLVTTVASRLSRLLPAGAPELGAWGRHGRSYLAGLVQFPGQKQFDAFYDQLVIVARRHRIQPYGGRSLVVLAENNPDGSSAWAPFLTGDAEYVEVAAEHSSLLREPHATQLAEILQARLEKSSTMPPHRVFTGSRGR